MNKNSERRKAARKEISDNVDINTRDFLDKYQRLSVHIMNNFRYDLDKLFDNSSAELREKTARDLDRRTWEESINDYREQGLLDDNETLDFEIDVLTRAVFILQLMGFTTTARQVAVVNYRLDNINHTAGEVLKKTLNGAIKENRSKAASTPRHPQRTEILDVIKATWEINPTGSKTRMIQYILEKYKVDEKTLKTWMKDENLKPLLPVANKPYALVIPEQWRKEGE